MRARDERGSITPFVVIVSLALLMLAALVVDGGRQLNAKGRALAYAQEAARAGAQAIDVNTDRLDLDQDVALRAARQYCAEAMANDPQLVLCDPSIQAVNDRGGTYHGVRVEARVQLDAILLGIIGRHELRSSGQALATPVSGISEADSGRLATVGPPTVAPPGGEPPTGPVPPPIEVTPCTPVPTETPTPTDTPTPTEPTPTDRPGGGRPTDEPSPTATPTPTPEPGQPPFCATPDVPE